MKPLAKASPGRLCAVVVLAAAILLQPVLSALQAGAAINASDSGLAGGETIIICTAEGMKLIIPGDPIMLPQDMPPPHPEQGCHACCMLCSGPADSWAQAGNWQGLEFAVRLKPDVLIPASPGRRRTITLNNRSPPAAD